MLFFYKSEINYILERPLYETFSLKKKKSDAST